MRAFSNLFFLLFVPSLSLAMTKNFEGTWVGSGGSLKNSRGYETACETVRLQVTPVTDNYYQVTLEASCGGIHYRENFSDVKNEGDQLMLNDSWGWVMVRTLGDRLHASGRWFNIAWPNTIGTVNANLEIDLTR